jgi:urea transport system permease protein
VTVAAGARPSLLVPLLRATPRAGWWALGAVAVLAFGVLPALHLLVPAGHPLHVSDYVVTVAGKIACYATVAVALDLVWGYVGILSLGHGLFFALGGYAFGMYLMRSIGRDGVYQSDLPDFMVFLDWKQYPWFWRGTQHAAWAAALVVLVPGLVAFVFGWFAFRSRIKGVYFSIITQALTYAAMLFFFRNDAGFGGNNGFTDFQRIFDFPIAAPGTRVALLAASVAVLLATLVLCRWLVSSPFGGVLRAIRDGEPRLRALGYDPLWYKLLVWTLSAILCGVAGALYVPQVGIINPSEMSTSASIEIAIWVAVGGRGTLVGAVLGAVLVNLAKSWFTKAMPELWPFFLGALFVAVTLFLPQGVVGLLRGLRPRTRGPTPARDPAPPGSAATEEAPA